MPPLLLLQVAHAFCLLLLFSKLFAYLFTCGCAGSLVLRAGFLWLQGFSLCCFPFRAQASERMAQEFCCGGSTALRHVGSSWPRGGTHVPCIGRRIVNHWTTTLPLAFLITFLLLFYFSYCSSEASIPSSMELDSFLPVLNRNSFHSGLEATNCRSSVYEVLSENISLLVTL